MISDIRGPPITKGRRPRRTKGPPDGPWPTPRRAIPVAPPRDGRTGRDSARSLAQLAAPLCRMECPTWECSSSHAQSTLNVHASASALHVSLVVFHLLLGGTWKLPPYTLALNAGLGHVHAVCRSPPPEPPPPDGTSRCAGHAQPPWSRAPQLRYRIPPPLPPNFGG